MNSFFYFSIYQICNKVSKRDLQPALESVGPFVNKTSVTFAVDKGPLVHDVVSTHCDQ